MKITHFRWWLSLPMAAALACTIPSLSAQEPFSAVDLIKPIEAAPIEPAPLDASPIGEAPTVATDSAEQAEESAAPTDPAIDESQPREVIRERYGNGALRVEREMIQDGDGNFLRHGNYREYDIRGTLIVEGQYNRGRRVGIWQRLHAVSESPLFQTAPYKDFSGPYLSQANFTDDLLDGKWTLSDAHQRKISEIEFDKGERHGLAAWFYPNGVLMTQINYDHGRVHGEIVKWGADSAVVAKEKYQNGRKLSTKIDYFNKESKRREIGYLNAMLYARVPDDWDKAQLAVFETRGQDEKHGPFTTWHPNGNLARQGEFRYNHPVGKISYWYENGQPQMEGRYVDGKQHGDWTWYHPNGQKAIIGEYRDGVAIGQWTWWKEDGKVARKADMSAQRPAPVVQGLPQPPVPQREANIRIELVEPGAVQR